ncbi:hypothetical protein HK105_200834 [Polyrhizophydium stewartii]|uniref:Pentatricopeptide repeat-containing protein n=1 Tax=Polyrhizophydium stewartii TaxID=2732419 RepID=A0ABR4NK75_9FUNG|nr:hypothetical protein HK105_006278 [Polyrhizophydium stewartii]
MPLITALVAAGRVRAAALAPRLAATAAAASATARAASPAAATVRMISLASSNTRETWEVEGDRTLPQLSEREKLLLERLREADKAGDPQAFARMVWESRRFSENVVPLLGSSILSRFVTNLADGKASSPTDSLPVTASRVELMVKLMIAKNIPISYLACTAVIKIYSSEAYINGLKEIIRYMDSRKYVTDTPQIRHALIRAYAATHQNGVARRLFDKEIANPPISRPFMAYARGLFSANNTEALVSLLRLARSKGVDPTAEALITQLCVKMLLSEEKYEQVLQTIDDSVRARTPERDRVLFSLKLAALNGLGRHEDVLALAAESSTLNSHNARAEVVSALVALGRNDEAWREFPVIINAFVAKTNPKTYDTLLKTLPPGQTPEETFEYLRAKLVDLGLPTNEIIFRFIRRLAIGGDFDRAMGVKAAFERSMVPGEKYSFRLYDSLIRTSVSQNNMRIFEELVGEFAQLRGFTVEMRSLVDFVSLAFVTPGVSVSHVVETLRAKFPEIPARGLLSAARRKVHFMRIKDEDE